MHAPVTLTTPEARYRGLRMTAKEYLALPQDGFKYELIDGVVCMSPSANFRHQTIQGRIVGQIDAYLLGNPIGKVAPEADVRLGPDLVYRPDVVFVRSDKAVRCGAAVTEVPDLVVEIISPESRSYDSKTKRGDYEATGVGEYWLIDPEQKSFRFLVLRDGAFVEAVPTGDRYAAHVLPGFELDLDLVRRLF